MSIVYLLTGQHPNRQTLKVQKIAAKLSKALVKWSRVPHLLTLLKRKSITLESGLNLSKDLSI
jgi:hypothetical protein